MKANEKIVVIRKPNSHKEDMSFSMTSAFEAAALANWLRPLFNCRVITVSMEDWETLPNRFE